MDPELPVDEGVEGGATWRWPWSFCIILAANVAVFIWVNYLSVTWLGKSGPVSTSASSASSARETPGATVGSPVPAPARTDGNAADSAGVADEIVSYWRTVAALSEKDSVGSFAPWMLLTHQLLHSRLVWLVLGMLAMWWLCGALEHDWAWQKVLLFYVACGIGVCLCSLVVNSAYLGGSMAASLGMLMAVARQQGDGARFLGRIKLTTLFYIFLIALFVVGMFQPTPSAVLGYWAQGGGALAGFLFLRFEPVALRLMASWQHKAEHRRKVHKAQVSRQVDQLLDRISRHGMASLSRSERAFLRRASKLYRAHRDS